MKEHFVCGGKRIAVYDDLFPMSFRSKAFDFVNASLFSLGWGDSHEFYKRNHMFLHSVYSNDDLQKLGILDEIAKTEAAQEFAGYKISKAIVNLSTPADSNFVHIHPEAKVLLYYVNTEWQDGWHGETLFFDEPRKEIVFANQYTPGRLVAFDAQIPHAIRPQSHIAVPYRFTLAIILEKDC
jgi:hypothetical protein